MTNDRLRTYTLAAGATTLLATAGSVSGEIISSDGAMPITQSNQDIELFTFAGVMRTTSQNSARHVLAVLDGPMNVDEMRAVPSTTSATPVT